MKTSTRILATLACGMGLMVAAARADTPPTEPQLEAFEADAFAQLMVAAQAEPLMQIVATEGARHGLGLEASLFPGRGGAAWRQVVSTIQAPDRLVPLLAKALRSELAPEDAAAAARFLNDGAGARVVEREIVARRQMLDSDVEAEARQASAAAFENGTARAELIGEMIQALDLVTVNVSGGLNANYAFYRGLGDGGALKSRLTESEMIAMVWAQETQVRRSIRGWLQGYLSLAYAPLSDDELRDYLAFTKTAPGRRYMSAMFQGFGSVFETTSYELGLAAAKFIAQQDA
ncbi:hypothetical protein [uncultured Jannaschia sp.]|uniref:hypothetical protein n=1 Tax=uncultured Jannaschia sp. TaxID=293347 RepID=UPI002621F127|nr:hypothetical protein [uncultured Jannaschia sp.]